MSAPKRMAVEDLVDMTAMVDIVFFVLIFFMVTSMQGVYSSISMPTPDQQKVASQGRRSVAEFEKADFVIVRIDRDNTVWLNDREIPGEGDDNARSLELLVQLRALRQAGSASNKMLVMGNSEAKHGTVVMVLDAGSEAGMDEIQLAVDDES
jgi:biopolymer transport protein ExbD